MTINKTWIISELKVVASLAISLLITNSIFINQLMNIYSGNYSEVIWQEILVLIGQSVVRAVLTLLFPMIFNHRTTTSLEASKASINEQDIKQ